MQQATPTTAHGSSIPPWCAPREPPAEPFTGPDGLEQRLVSFVASARSRLLAMAYLLDCEAIVDALVEAAARGVVVRVLIDGRQPDSLAARTRLASAGVPLRESPAAFPHAHAKVLVADDAAIVMSANLNGWSMESERNYGVVLRDPADVRDLVAVFEADWAESPTRELAHTRLVLSPSNARARVTELVRSARERLWLALMYCNDPALRSLLVARAGEVRDVRVLLANPDWIAGNRALAEELSRAGAEVRFVVAWDLHAKLVLADGAALIGSHNLSPTSLDENREIGLGLCEPGVISRVEQQLELDWAEAVAPEDAAAEAPEDG